MTQIFTGTGLGTQGSSLGQLGSYGPKSNASLGRGGESVYVNGANGNLVLKQSDGFLSDLGLGMDVFQTYNSKGEGTNPWRFNLETHLMFEGTPNTVGSIVQRIDEDGHLSRFTYDTHQNVYIAEDGSKAKMTYHNGDWQYQKGSGQTRCNYNSKGQLTSLSDKDGHVLSITYENGLLSRITDTRDKQTITWSFSQGVLGDVAFVSDGQSIHHLHYEYDDQNRLTKVSRTLGDGKTYWISYGYVGDTNLISHINQSDGTQLYIEYDQEGRVKRLVDGEGRVSTYEYLKGKTVVTNGLGESWTYFYDADARLTGIDGPENYHARYYYEGKRLVAVTQGKQRWNFTYNDAGDCIRIEEPSGDVIRRTFNTEHHILTETRYQRFDGEHHPIQPHTTRYVYDEQGHLRFEIKADGRVTEYRYDQEGLLLTTRCYLRAHFDAKSLEEGQALSLEALTQWSQKQNPQAISLTSYTYDWRGNLCEEIHYTAIDEQGNGILTKDTLKSYSRFDAAGRLIEKSLITEKGLTTTHYFYDGLGRLIRTTDNQQHETSIEYDDAHRRVIKTDANGLKTISSYDQSGLLLCTQRIDNSHDFGRTTYCYDAASRLISETDVSGKTNYYFYDAQGRLAARVTASGQVSEYQYDDEGHCIKTHLYQKHLDTRGFKDNLPDWNSIKPETSNQDRISQVVYNEFHQIAYQINAEGAVIAYQYDAEGRVIAKTAYANRLAHFAPERTLIYSNVVIQTSPKDRTITYYYDAEGRLEGEINGEGASTGYRYDAIGNLIETRHFSNYTKLTRSGDWTLDIPKDSELDIRTFSLYNSAGLKIADLDAQGYLTEYRYDSRGLLTDVLSYYTQLDYSFTPDEYTTLAAIRPKDQANDHHTKYRYNDLNQLIEEQTQGGLITTYTYNEAGQIITKTNTDKKTHEARTQRYRYDTLGRVIQSIDALGALRLKQSEYLNKDEIEAIWQQHSIHYTYNNAGLLLSKTNALNQTTHYFYNKEGLLTLTLSAEGSVTETRYNAFSQIETTIRYHSLWKGNADISTEQLQGHIDALADQRFDEVTHYDYNSLGLVTRKRQVSGSEMTTTYNAFGELEQTIQRISLNHQTITEYQYDRRGLRRMLTEDLGGLNKTFETQYDAFGRRVRTFDGRQKEKAYLLNKRGEVLRIDNAGHCIKEMSYDAFGRILSLKDKTETNYIYNDKNNTLTLERSVDEAKVVTEFNAFGDKITLTDGNKHTTIFQYDAKGQLIHIDGPEHSSTEYQYDAEGQLIYEQKGKNHKIRYTYDAEGRVLTKTIDPKGLNISTLFTYDGIGRQLSVNEEGRLTQFTYDNRGNLIKKCLDPKGLNLITEFSYNEKGLLVRQTTYNTQGNNKIIAYEWDALGRCIVTTIDPDGLALTTGYEYDNNNNLICQTDAKQQRTQYLYDANNQLRYRIDARGVVTEHVYGIKGSEIRTITYANRITSLRRYDEASLLEAIRPDTNVDQYQFFTYDKQGRLTRSYDSLGYATAYTYDSNDNIIAKKHYAVPSSLSELKNGKWPQPNDSKEPRVTHFAYDGLNQERFQIDASGRVTEYRYDSAGQVIQQTRFAHTLSLNEINDDCSLSSIQNALQRDAVKDQSIYYAYDAAGRLQAQANSNGSVTSYQYDDAGNLIATIRYAKTITDTVLIKENWSTQLQRSINDRTTRAVFDAAGREVYRISATGKVVSRHYDEAGNVITERVYAKTLSLSTYNLNEINDALKYDNPKDQLTIYQYDVNGRLLNKTDALNHSTSYTYDKNNNVASKTDANNACWTYHYDECNQLIETSTPKIKVSRYLNGKHIEEQRSIKTKNTYDSFGNLTSTIRDAEGIKQTIQYIYDTNNQKLATIYPDVMVNKAGHKASAERQEEMKTLSETFSYNAFGEVISSTDKAGHIRHWAYDLSGNMLFSIDAKNGLTQYQYDSFDNLQKKTTYANPLVLDSDTDFSADTIERAHHINDHDRHESYWYDKEGRLIKTSKDEVISYNSHTGEYQNLSPTKKITYNVFGEVIQTEVQLSDTKWAITSSYYNLEGLKTAQIDAEGYLTTYTYDDFCLVESEVQFAERCKEWTPQHYKEPQHNAKDRSATFIYDAVGKLISKTLKGVSYQHLTANNSQYKNITGDLTSSYRYDALGNLVSTTDALGHTVYSYYNEVGQLTAKVGTITQSGRSATTYSYDALGQLIETHQWAKGAKKADETNFSLEGESNKDIITTDVYDVQGHLIQQINGSGHQINYSFDANGNITRSWQVLQRTGKSALIQDKRYAFDAENHLIQSASIKANGIYATDDAQYNAFGEIVAKGLNGNYTTHIDYDKLGRVWRSNLQGYYQIYVYDLSDHVTQVVTSTNAFGIENDEKGVDLSKSEFEKAINYNEQRWLYDLQRQDNVYDALGRLLSQSKESSTSVTDKKNKKVSKKASQVNELDRWGNVISHTNANKFITLYEYNAFDQVTKQTLPQVKVVDEHGVAKMISPELNFAYDALGRVIAMTDANKHTLAKLLDADGHVIQEIDALGRHRDKSYDLLGQLTNTTTKRNNATITINYTYDKANRLLSVGTPKSMQYYTYDEAGQLIKQSDGLNGLGNVTRYEYDELGHQVAREQRDHKTTIAFDDAGHKLSEKDAKGNTQSWAYDEYGRLKEHIDLGKRKTAYTYNKNGLILTEKVINGKKDKAYHYYSDGQLEQYEDKSRHEVVDFIYDDEGNLISKESSAIDAWIVETDHYAYDALGRLIQVRRRNPKDTDRRFPDADKALLSIDYEYDAVGNIRDTKVMARYASHQRVTQNNYYRYDENNRMILSKGQLQNGNIVMTTSQGSELSYDETGNISSAKKYEGGALHHYSYHYNTDNLLDIIQKDGHNFQTKEYDAAGNVIKEHRYNNLGNATQHNSMHYEKGLLKRIQTTDKNNKEVSIAQYDYDSVDNIEKLTTVVRAQGKTAGYTQTHKYTYELWDSYQQALDSATLTISGQTTTYGSSKRTYDANGQLKEVLDSKADSKGLNNTTQYLTSSMDGIRARIDKDGQTSYLTVAGKTIGDLRLDKKGVTHLEVYGGFTPSGTPEQANGMMPSLWQGNKTLSNIFQNTKPSGEATPPEAPQDSLGTYSLQLGDTLESIALQVYGDASLWYLIADANGITDRNDRAGEKGSQMHVGQRLNIPPAASGQHHTNSTHKVLNSSDWIGNTSATTPLPPAPPPSPRHNSPWRILGKIAVAVIATIATVLSAGAIGAALGAISSAGGLGGLLGLGTAVLGGGGGAMLAGSTLLGSVGAGFAAGFIGSIAGQGAAALFGLQKGIDLKGALITGIATAATAGVANALSNNATYQNLINTMDSHSANAFSIRTATEMMERDVLSQGINIGTRKHQHLDWLELSISTATAGFIGSNTGKSFNQNLEKTFKKATPTISSELQSLVTGAATSAATGTHFDAAQVLTENLGSAIGNNILQAAEAMGTKEVVEGAVEAAKNAIGQDNKQKSLAELMQVTADTRAEQLRGAWNDDISDDLNFESDLFKSWSGGDAIFENKMYWNFKPHGIEEFIDYPIVSLDSMGLTFHKSEIMYQESTYSFKEALSRQMNLKGNASPKFWVGGSKLWKNASREQVGNSMNVDELLSDPINKMQFMDLHYQEGISADELDVLLDGKGMLSGKGSTFLQASKDNNINPIYLISHALLESGGGRSALAKHNNFFGLGAIDGHAFTGGVEFASNHGWVTPELGIMGGAKIISKKWINDASKSQSTLYSMRWNPMNPGGNPQYATDIGWASKQTKIIYDLVNKIQQINNSYKPVYLVPRYRD